MIRQSEYAPGQTIPGTQYRFVRMLGSGGHGSVYAVEHTFLQAPAVMKLLHAELANEGDLAQRMTREARTLAQLRHPNIVEVRDGGITDEDPARPFFVMEPLDGMSIRDLVRHMGGRGIGVLPGLRIMINVLEGLHHAHRAGVIHRDVKPDNVFLHRTSTDVTVPKVLDFGIAHLTMGKRFTGQHFLGTPRYAAPEQLNGLTPTAATDIYAAGLVLQELLTGKAPFHDRKEIGALLQAHLNEYLPPVSSLCPDAPTVLDGYLREMLDKNPEKRPPTAFAAAVALREIRSYIEARQEGSMHKAEFKTEPTPMDNLLFEVGPGEVPYVTEGGRPLADDTTPGAPPFSTELEAAPAVEAAAPSPSARPPARIQMTIPMAGRPVAAPEIDRAARTRTGKRPLPVIRIAGSNDTEPFSQGANPALADTTPVHPPIGPSASPRSSRVATSDPTPGALAVAVDGAAERVPPQSWFAGRGRQVLVFVLALGAICGIGLPLVFTHARTLARDAEPAPAASPVASVPAPAVSAVPPAPASSVSVSPIAASSVSAPARSPGVARAAASGGAPASRVVGR